MFLADYSKNGFRSGAPVWKMVLWFFVGQWALRTRLFPFSNLKCQILRLFGASIGRGVRIKMGVQVTYPWQLRIGDHSWIGENVWIDNLAPVVIGSNCCVSQGAYLCTGSHDWTVSTFDLRVQGISIRDHSWVAAKCCVGPGVTVGEGAVLTLGSVASSDLSPWTICRGVPAVTIRERPRITSPAQRSGAEVSSD